VHACIAKSNTVIGGSFVGNQQPGNASSHEHEFFQQGTQEFSSID